MTRAEGNYILGDEENAETPETEKALPSVLEGMGGPGAWRHDNAEEWDVLDDGYFSAADRKALCQEVWEERDAMRWTLTDKQNRDGILRFIRPQHAAQRGPSRTHTYEAMGGTGQLIAVRETVLDGPEMCQKNWQRVQRLMVEMETLRSLEHPHVVSYMGVTVTESVVCVIMELCSGGSLARVLGRFGALERNLVHKFTCQVLEGLLYLHKHGIAHGGLNLSNCLLDTDGNVKLSGLGENVFDAASATSATSLYCPPEVFHGLPCGRQADIWCLGVCVVEMYVPSNQRVPVSHLYFQELATMQEAPSPPDACCPVSQSFINACRTIDPSERPNALALRQHPYVSLGWLANAPHAGGGKDNFSRRDASSSVDLGAASLNPWLARDAEGGGVESTRPKSLSAEWSKGPLRAVGAQHEGLADMDGQGSGGSGLGVGAERRRSSSSPVRRSLDGHRPLVRAVSSVSSTRSSDSAFFGSGAGEGRSRGTSSRSLDVSPLDAAKRGKKKASGNSQLINKDLGVFHNPMLETMFVSGTRERQHRKIMQAYPFMTAAGILFHIAAWIWWAVDQDEERRGANVLSVVISTVVVLLPEYILKRSKWSHDSVWVLGSMCSFQQFVTYPWLICSVMGEGQMMAISRITFLCCAYTIISVDQRVKRLCRVYLFYLLLILVYHVWNGCVDLSVSPNGVAPILSLVLPSWAVSYLMDGRLCLDCGSGLSLLCQFLSDPERTSTLTQDQLNARLYKRFQTVLVCALWMLAGIFISSRSLEYSRLKWVIENKEVIKKAKKALNKSTTEAEKEAIQLFLENPGPTTVGCPAF